jgi:hypothetical protein
LAHKTIKHGGVRIAAQTAEKRAKNPLNNEEFFSEIQSYLELRKIEVAAGRDIPQIPDCLGSKILMIAEMLSKKYYFVGYSYRDEMVMDAVINCITYIDKFDHTKTHNPFSYFTQVCFYAFIRRIQSEKKQTYIKSQVVQNLGVVFDELVKHEGNVDQEFHTTIGEILASQADPSLEKLFGKKAKVAKVEENADFDIFDVDAPIIKIDTESIIEEIKESRGY